MRGVGALWLMLVLAGCRTGGTRPEVTATPAPSPPPPAATTVDGGADVPGPEAPAASTADAPRPYPGAPCFYTTAKLQACSAQGNHCELASEPRKSPCAGKGTRCLPLEDKHEDPRAPCMCTCSAEYQRRREAVRDRSKDPKCTEVVDLTTGKKVTECEEPELPR